MKRYQPLCNGLRIFTKWLHHRQIVDKTCVVSALDDRLQTIKTYLINAALKQGMSQSSNVTALADGANNC